MIISKKTFSDTIYIWTYDQWWFLFLPSFRRQHLSDSLRAGNAFCFCFHSKEFQCYKAILIFAFIWRSTNDQLYKAIRPEARKALAVIFNNQCSLQWTKPSKIFKVAMLIWCLSKNGHWPPHPVYKGQQPIMLMLQSVYFFNWIYKIFI